MLISLIVKLPTLIVEDKVTKASTESMHVTSPALGSSTKARKPHGWLPSVEPLLRSVEAPEFVLDGVLAAGAVVFAGERGLGKTSVLLPMMMAVAGVIDYPFKASIRRRVFYVTEDIEQARRIIAAIHKHGLITVDEQELQKMFQLCPAHRISIDDAILYPKMLVGDYEPNKCVDGSSHKASPVVVLDTVNTTLQIDNLNDNSEVSQAISRLREAFDNIPLITVGHVPKASRGDAKRASFNGAGAWENDTQQTIYLVQEGGQRYLVMGKNRFVPDYSEFLIESHLAEFTSLDKLKREVVIKAYYGIPVGVSELEKAKAQEEAKAVSSRKAQEELKSRIMAEITIKAGQGIGEIKRAVGGNSQKISDAIAVLEDEGLVRIKEEGKARTCYPVSQNDAERYGSESNS